jgi:DNA-binding response OmpR family regulator
MRILTVDDSSTIRTIIAKTLGELGFAIEQAEDGQQGLAKLATAPVDLILLDVTMPVMDGPTMLEKLRATGDKTPVIMLTSEAKRSIMVGAIKLGVSDYILKPFKGDELRSKVLKTLRLDEATLARATRVAAVVATPDSVVAAAPSSDLLDLLVIDDMENVHKKLRTLLPEAVSMRGCANARDAIQACRDASYRVIVIDLVIPEVNSVTLMTQLRELQPHAVMTALALRSATDVAADAKSRGFDDCICKPFDAALIAEWRARSFARAAA